MKLLVLLVAGSVLGCARAEPGALEPGADAPAAPDARASDAGADAAAVDAVGVLPDAAPDACLPSWIELLANPGFDAGVAPWLQQGTVITDDAGMPISPQAGTHSAWFGGANAADDRLAQTVTVPADAMALRVRLFECFVTADTSGADDFFTASLRDGNGVELEVLRSASNLEVPAVCSWTEATWTASTPHAGAQVELSLRATTDALFPTSWYVDSLAFEALVPCS